MNALFGFALGPLHRYYFFLSLSRVAQRQSIRLLIGRLLVRIQSQEQMPRVLMNSGLFVDREGEQMQVLADHVYHVLVIAFVAATVIEVIVKAVNKPRKKKRGPDLDLALGSAE